MECDKLRIKWIGRKTTREVFNRTADCYESVLIGETRIKLGDHVLIIKDGNKEDGELACDVAKILQLYENCDEHENDKYGAIVEWYSRPKDIPQKSFSEDIVIDFDNEVVLDLRPFGTAVYLESVFSKCFVNFGYVDQCASDLLKSSKKNARAYVCRYVYRRMNHTQKFHLLPVVGHFDGVYDVNIKDSRRSNKFHLDLEKSTPGRAAKEKAINVLKSIDQINEIGSITPRRSRRSIYQDQDVTNSPKTPRRKTNLSTDTINSPVIEDTPKRNRAQKYKENLGNIKEEQWSIKRKSTCSPIKDITNNTDSTMSPVIPLVSPIKIINKAVLSKITAQLNENKRLTANDISKELDSDEESEKQIRSRKPVACRNLNDSLNCMSENMDTDEDVTKVQYSVILDKNQPNKIKLKVSDSLRNQNINELSNDHNSDSLQSSDDSLVSSSISSPKSNYNYMMKKSIVKLQRINLEDTKLNLESKSALTSSKKSFRSTTRVRKSNSKYSQDYELSPTKKLKSLKKNIENSNENLVSTPIKSQKVQELQETPKRSKLFEANTPITPGLRLKQFKSGNMTPTMQSRNTPSTPSSGLSLARERLHVSAVPKSLPCRETEFNDIFTFVQGKLLDHSGGCMYISGVPGTGKTATVTEVIKCLQKLSKEKKIPKFDFIEVNGMRLTEPRQAYVHIYRQMEGKTVPWEQALSALDKKFLTSGKTRISTVLLVDELDILCTKRQDVVYTILDWPSKANSKLIVITIANTMDLPERLLRAKVTSRLGLTRRTFAPYSHKQLMDIVMSRLYGIDLFNSDAVQLVARKVAAVSGDARRALDICRRATEIAEFSEATKKNGSNSSAIVSMVHVNQALSEMITSAKVTAIQNCSTMEKIFLQAVSAEVARTGVEETTFGSVFSHITSLCSLEGLINLPSSTALSICCRLGSKRLLITEVGRFDLNMKILLNVGSDDLHYALQEV